MATFWPFLGPVFSASHAQQISDLHSKFALRPHHVSKYGRHPTCDRWDKARKKDRKKQDKNIYVRILLCRATTKKRVRWPWLRPFGDGLSHIDLHLPQKVTRTENFVKFGQVVFDTYASGQTYSQTYRHAHRNTSHHCRDKNSDYTQLLENDNTVYINLLERCSQTLHDD